MANAKRAPARRRRAAKIARGTATSVRKKSVSSNAKKSAPHPRPLPTIRFANGGRGEGSASAAAPKTKRRGGPVAGTPSPLRTRLSAELHEHARRLFTETDQPGTEIAADCGVDESVIRRMAKREGWVRYVAPPHQLPPVAKLLAEVEALDASLSDRHPEVRGLLAEPRRIDAKLSQESAVHPSRLASLAPQDDGEGAERDLQKDIAEFEHAVMGYVREFDALRRNGKLLVTQHLATARAINTLTDAFNKLQRLRVALPGSIHDDVASAELPADPDAFRDELARRIDAFIASRANAADAGDGAAQPADAAP